ncbi:hypothetical protein EXS65_03130 [Candidatus Peribacteria bacterium]|nr:hypothetical protein [Candidatus Peribacteria bacterium]
MKRLLSSIIVLSLATLSACGSEKDATNEPSLISGGRSAIFAIDPLIALSTKLQMQRSAALLGVFIAEYISFSQTALASQGALTGIAVDQQIMVAGHTITDPDYDLLQAFGDALQVDIADLLNRSTDRQQTLDAYTRSLTNVASRSNGRYRELSGALEELKTLLRTQSKERSDADRALQNAIRAKDFSEAGELQKTVIEKQQAYSETDLKRKQTEDILETFASLLTLYGEKNQAIRQNREILIAGNRIVDVPGIEELQIIQRQKGSRRSGRGADQFQSLFEGL